MIGFFDFVKVPLKHQKVFQNTFGETSLHFNLVRLIQEAIWNLFCDKANFWLSL